MAARCHFTENTIFKACPYLEMHNLFYSNGLDIQHGFPDITHIKLSNDQHFKLYRGDIFRGI